jgi:hypothetical protein
MNATIHFILAAATGAMALLTWHRSMPRVITLRGRWHGWCEWLLGLGLALLSPALLAQAINDTPISWQFALADTAFVTYAFCRFRWLKSQSSGSWRCSA